MSNKKHDWSRGKPKYSEDFVKQLYQEYLAGQSTNTLAHKYYMKQGTVFNLFKKFNLKTRNIRDGMFMIKGGEKGWIDDNGYKMISRNQTEYREHDWIWIQHNGLPVPKGCVVHHRNGNKLDNRIENLVLLPAGYHNHLHLKIRYSNGRLKLPEV